MQMGRGCEGMGPMEGFRYELDAQLAVSEYNSMLIRPAAVIQGVVDGCQLSAVNGVVRAAAIGLAMESELPRIVRFNRCQARYTASPNLWGTGLSASLQTAVGEEAHLPIIEQSRAGSCGRGEPL